MWLLHTVVSIRTVQQSDPGIHIYIYSFQQQVSLLVQSSQLPVLIATIGILVPLALAHKAALFNYMMVTLPPPAPCVIMVVLSVQSSKPIPLVTN